jgi:hypothetical protein
VRTPSAPSRQLGAFLIALGLALGAIGLPRWPHVAWALSVSLNVVAAVAVLRLVGAYVARRAPFAAAAVAAFLTGASVLLPTLARSPVPVSALAVVAAVTFLAGFVLWLEAFEPPATHPL